MVTKLVLTSTTGTLVIRLISGLLSQIVDKCNKQQAAFFQNKLYEVVIHLAIRTVLSTLIRLWEGGDVHVFLYTIIFHNRNFAAVFNDDLINLSLFVSWEGR